MNKIGYFIERQIRDDERKEKSIEELQTKHSFMQPVKDKNDP